MKVACCVLLMYSRTSREGKPARAWCLVPGIPMPTRLNDPLEPLSTPDRFLWHLDDPTWFGTSRCQPYPMMFAWYEVYTSRRRILLLILIPGTWWYVCTPEYLITEMWTVKHTHNLRVRTLTGVPVLLHAVCCTCTHTRVPLSFSYIQVSHGRPGGLSIVV